MRKLTKNLPISRAKTLLVFEAGVGPYHPYAIMDTPPSSNLVNVLNLVRLGTKRTLYGAAQFGATLTWS